MNKFKYLYQLIFIYLSYKKYNSSCDKHLSNCFKAEIKKVTYDILQII